MIDAICRELKLRSDYLDKRKIETIYFGGGTPSILFDSELKQIFEVLKLCYNLSDEMEITLEANPDDITENRLMAWRRLGVNRLSIGIQSFKSSDLEWMNRAHSVEEGENCLHLAKQFGFNNLTVDLMYGLPNLSDDEWKSHIQKVLDLDVPHISAYCLTVEDRTVLDNWVKNGKIVPASEDQQSEQFLILLDLLESNGFVQYEISNFAKEGFESVHNANYWKGKWYLGVGPSAHSFNGEERQWNISNNQLYIKGVNSDSCYWEKETLSVNDRFNELILTGLRMAKGVCVADLESIQPVPNDIHNLVAEFVDQGLIEKDFDFWRLTKTGRLKADWIASELFIA